MTKELDESKDSEGEEEKKEADCYLIIGGKKVNNCPPNTPK